MTHVLVHVGEFCPKKKSQTYASAATAGGTATTATATSATTTRGTTAGSLSARSFAVGTLSLLASRLRLAGKLDRDLALKDFLAGELSNSTLSLRRSREVDKGVANRAVGARVLGDRDRLTIWVSTVSGWSIICGQVATVEHVDNSLSSHEDCLVTPSVQFFLGDAECE